jgi:hypothetical protein
MGFKHSRILQEIIKIKTKITFMKTTITIGGKELEIDLEKAKELGLCREVHQKITSFKVGDVFGGPGFSNVLITQSHYGYQEGKKYDLAKTCGLELYSAFLDGARTESEILEYLNKNKLKFIKNINKEIIALIR